MDGLSGYWLGGRALLLWLLRVLSLFRFLVFLLFRRMSRFRVVLVPVGRRWFLLVLVWVPRRKKNRCMVAW